MSAVYDELSYVGYNIVGQISCVTNLARLFVQDF